MFTAGFALLQAWACGVNSATHHVEDAIGSGLAAVVFLALSSFIARVAPKCPAAEPATEEE